MDKKYDFSDFDKPTEAPAAKSGYDFSDFDETPAPAEEAPDMGRLEAGITSFGQGSSLGLAPIASGVVGALGNVAEQAGDALGLTTDSKLEEQGFSMPDKKSGLEGLMAAYYDSRDRQKAAQDTAHEQYPAQSIALNIAGSIPTTIAAGGLTSGVKMGQGSDLISKAAGLVQKATPNIASKILPQADKFTAATGVGSKIAAGMREGAKAGALVGLGEGDAKLGEGEVYDTFRDVADSAVGGAAVGGIIPAGVGAAKGIAGFVGDLPIINQVKTAFKGGQAGIKLNEKAAGDAIKTYSEDLLGEIQSQFRKAGLTKANAMDYADEVGVRVNAGEAFQDVMDDVVSRGASSTADMTEKQALLKTFNELKNGPANKMQDKLDLNSAKMQQKMEAKGFNLLDSDVQKGNVADFVPGTNNAKPLALNTQNYQKIAEETGDEISDTVVESPIVSKLIQQAGDELPISINKYDLDNLTLRELQDVMGEVNRHTGDLKGPASTNTERTARTLAAQLKTLRDEALSNAGADATGNQSLHKTFAALDRAGIDDNVLTNSGIRKDAMVDKLRNTVTAGNGIDRERMFQYLKEASPDGTYNKFESGAEFLNDFSDLAKQVKPLNSSNAMGVLGSAKNIGLAGANVAGKGYQSLKDLASLPVEKISQIAQKFSSSPNTTAQSYASPLLKAAQGDERQRAAIMYGLYQQPAFRELYQSMGEEMNDIVMPVGTDREDKN